MSNLLLINSTPEEKRVAVVENGTVMELYVEKTRDQSIVGNIYLGRVLRVLPGMQAAFIDIGFDRAAFLYVSDVKSNLRGVYLGEEFDEKPPQEDDTRGIESLLEGETQEFEIEESTPKTPNRAPREIQDLLSEGEEILVQVAKAPMGTKGARVTAQISLPGRNLVLIPNVEHIGVSRRIGKEGERERLKEMVARLKPPHMGFIVRTVCEGKTEQQIQEDMDYLLNLWRAIDPKQKSMKAPALIHRDLDVVQRAVRDLFTPEIDRLVIDDPQDHRTISSFLEAYLPKSKRSLELYQGHEPIFDAFNIEGDIARALGRKVWLKSGGYIIIDQTEALTSIDVNTGKFVGKRNLEDTILKTNLEAVREIAIQLRLRNIGGLIIIDFIDMTKKTNRERVWNNLSELLENDRAKSNILKFSELGLVEMTRKRTQESLVRSLCSPCPYCEGKAYIKSPLTVIYEIFRMLRREYQGENSNVDITLNVHPEIADRMADEERTFVDLLEKSLHVKISIKAKKDFHLEQYEILER